MYIIHRLITKSTLVPLLECDFSMDSSKSDEENLKKRDVDQVEFKDINLKN